MRKRTVFISFFTSCTQPCQSEMSAHTHPVCDVCARSGSRLTEGMSEALSVLCSLSGAGGCEDELAARSGSGLLIFSAAAGTGVVFLSPRRSEGGLAPGSGADYPSGGGGAWT